MLLIVRYIIHRRQHSEEEDEDLAASIDKLKKELQQSADTIIKRLGSHVTKLEGLLREADDRRIRLETRVADAQRLEWALRQRVEELEQRLRSLGAAPTPSSPAASVQAAPPVQPAAHTTSPQEVRRTDGEDFAAVLHASILREQMRGAAHEHVPQTAPSQTQPTNTLLEASAQGSVLRADAAAAQGSVLTEAEEAQPLSEEPASPPREDEAIIKARALLRAGRTIEQVARETGVEIGALRLMKQMTQRD